MKAEHVRVTLLAQHAELRAQLAIAVDLADRLLAGAPVGDALDRALAGLRAQLAAHNDDEAHAISTLLRSAARWSVLMRERMVEEHLAEHAAMWTLLAGSRREVAGRMRDLAEELDAHMAAEERTFLSPQTLRDDVIARRTGEIAPIPG